MTRLTRIAHRAPRSLAKGRLEWRRGQRCIAPVQSAWATTDRQLPPRGIIGRSRGRSEYGFLQANFGEHVHAKSRGHTTVGPLRLSSILSHVTGFLPKRCMPVTYGPPARCSLSLDESDRRLAAILTCRSTAPTATSTKASRAATTPVPRRSFTRRPSLSSRSARSKTDRRVAQREGTKERDDEHQAA